MNDISLVGVGDGVGQVVNIADDFRIGSGLRLNVVIESCTGKRLHRHKEDAALAVKVVDGDDVGVGQGLRLVSLAL